MWCFPLKRKEGYKIYVVNLMIYSMVKGYLSNLLSAWFRPSPELVCKTPIFDFSLGQMLVH